MGRTLWKSGRRNVPLAQARPRLIQASMGRVPSSKLLRRRGSALAAVRRQGQCSAGCAQRGPTGGSLALGPWPRSGEADGAAAGPASGAAGTGSQGSAGPGPMVSLHAATVGAPGRCRSQAGVQQRGLADRPSVLAPASRGVAGVQGRQGVSRGGGKASGGGGSVVMSSAPRWSPRRCPGSASGGSPGRSRIASSMKARQPGSC